jgi:hypothetical protein
MGVRNTDSPGRVALSPSSRKPQNLYGLELDKTRVSSYVAHDARSVREVRNTDTPVLYAEATKEENEEAPPLAEESFGHVGIARVLKPNPDVLALSPLKQKVSVLYGAHSPGHGHGGEFGDVTYDDCDRLQLTEPGSASSSCSQRSRGTTTGEEAKSFGSVGIRC